MTEKAKRNTRKDGIHTMDDLIERCRLDDFTGCLVWEGPVHRGSGAVWIPQLGQARSVTSAFGLLNGEKLKAGQVWYAACGNVLCIAHRKRGTNSDAMRAVRPTLDPQHRARITLAARKRFGKYNAELASEIRSSTDSHKAAAVRTGLNESTISKIRNGVMWVETTASSSVFNWRPA